MLDAHPAPDALARPPLPAVAIDPPAPPARPVAGDALFATARILLPVLEAGRALDAGALRNAMTQAFGGSDASGVWLWKDAYEAAEAAAVLFLQRYGRAMRRNAGAGPDGPRRMLAMLDAIAALEPSHTRRSEEQVRLQQFSTPLPLAYAALQAAAIRPGDTVLEPSAGTGMLAVMAECALGASAAGHFHLNEYAQTRARLLTRLFPQAVVTAFNAEAIADRLHNVRPTVVLMNPPFSATPGVDRIRHDADLRHVRSAFSMLPPDGRLVTIVSANCVPGDAAWTDAFGRLDPPARCVFSLAIDGRAYARRGTGFDTRLTLLERSAEPSIDIDRDARAANAGELLDAVISRVPPRRPITPMPVRAGPARDLFGKAVAPKPAKRPNAGRASATGTRQAHNWGPVAELTIETGPVEPLQPAAETSANNTGPYAPWRPGAARVAGSVAHPTPLVQSAAMAAVPHPAPAWRPMLPGRVVTEGLLSDAQLESVVLGGEAHSRHLAAQYRIGSGWETVHRCKEHDGDEEEVDTSFVTTDGETLSDPVRFRRGWMLGDGTGCGKGRQVAAIILDNRLRGRKRALWLSQSDKLLEDARRDWTALGGLESDVIPLGNFRQGMEIPLADGILFATYATLRSPSRQGRPSRLDQIVQWLAGSLDEEDRHTFDGVIVFDEAHAMANAAGSKGERGEVKPSQQGRAGLRLQNALPDARIAYVSATGATTVPGLAYAGRLGLWAAGETPFETRTEFISAMEAGGVAAMEVVARDLKALGLYQARALAYEGVEVDILEHPLTPEQRRIYDSYAGAFKVIHQNIEEALKATGIVQGEDTLNRNAKSAALSAFEGTKQRFFGHLLTGMKCPSLIRAVEADIDAGRSAVVQLVSTGEALMERRIAEIPASEWDDLNIDLTPRDGILSFLMHAFPVQLQEPFTDDDGNLMSRPATDAEGNPVICREAEAQRDALIEKLAALPPVPTALDQVVQRFGHEAVAEVTGRSRRVLRISDAKGERLALRSRPASANLAETAAFMDRTKRILVFSMAGGTGRSYHADLSCENTERRIHYLLEPGWRADQAIQGLGRTHRTHQASAPLFRPVTTDVKGERRFIATIARRLDSLGAITRGQRDSQTAMGGSDAALFRESDNLESAYAKAALRQFYSALWRGRIEGWNVERFQDSTGLKIVHEGGLKDDLPPMPKFLNRLLALPIAEQNQLFAELEERIAANIEQAIEAGSYEVGVETVIADSLVIAGLGRQVADMAPGRDHPVGRAEIAADGPRLDRRFDDHHVPAAARRLPAPAAPRSPPPAPCHGPPPAADPRTLPGAAQRAKAISGANRKMKMPFAAKSMSRAHAGSREPNGTRCRRLRPEAGESPVFRRLRRPVEAASAQPPAGHCRTLSTPSENTMGASRAQPLHRQRDGPAVATMETASGAMFERRTDLTSLLAVAETGKIVAAAERLAISQPALSRTVARLEARFGGRLFERIPSGVRLTSLGALAAERARRVLRELEAAEEQIEAAVTGLAGCFRISAHPVWMQAVLPAAIARFHDTFPGIELKLRAADRPQGIRLLTEGASDLHCGGIDAGEPLPPFLRRDSFVEVEAGIVARLDHPLHARRARLEDLAGWPWVDYDGAAPADGDAGGRASLFGVLHNLHERTGRRAGTVIRAGPAGPFPMASGPYLAWLPLKFLHAFDPDLRPLPVSFGRHRYRTGFIARRSAEDLAAFRLLRQAVRDAALEKSGRPPG